MPDKGWKAFERRIAKTFRTVRRGADFLDRMTGGGNDDWETDGFASVVKYAGECKLLKRPSWSDILHAIEQVEESAPEGFTPIAVLKRSKMRDDNAIVCFRLKTFEKRFLYQPVGSDSGPS